MPKIDGLGRLHLHQKKRARTKVLFFQHSVHEGGAPRSLRKIVAAHEAEEGPQTVLFIGQGPVVRSYKGLKSRIVCGKHMLPFHGSEGSTMNWRMALRNIIGLLTLPISFFRYLRGYDVIYLNSSALCFFGLTTKLLSPRTKVIYHVREPLCQNIWGNISRFAIRHSADHCIAITKYELLRLGPLNCPAEVVHNYVGAEEFQRIRGQSAHSRDPEFPSEKFIVGYFARLDLKNGIEDFLELARSLSEHPKIAFCVYGHTGSEGAEIQSLLLAKSENVYVYPMVREVVENLGDLDVLIVPFKSPHFSRSVIEAGMLGVPSIAYDIESVSESIIDGQTGYLVSPNDPGRLAEKILLVMNNRETYNQLSEGARAHAEALFSDNNFEKIRDALNN